MIYKASDVGIGNPRRDARPQNVLIRTLGFDARGRKGPARGALRAAMEKRIHYRIDPNDESITLKDIMQKIQEIQRQHPDLDVFWDGDEYAVCSRPKKKE